MKLQFSRVALGALLMFSLSARAADAPDPVVGTWTLNAAKSTHSAVIYKSETRTYAAAPEGVSLTWERVSADGKKSVVTTTYKYDGKDYPVTGAAEFDAISAKRIDANTVETTEKRMGKEVGFARRAVSSDGKTLTLNQRFNRPDGHEFSAMMVYDRQ
jgi:hypothetical protein